MPDAALTRSLFSIDSEKTMRWSFAIASAALIIHLLDLLYPRIVPARLDATLAYIGVPVAAILFVLLSRTFARQASILLVSLSFLVAPIVSDLGASPRWLHLSVSLLAVFLMVIYLRIGPGWFAGLAIVCGIVAGWATDDPWQGLASGAAIGILFLAVNYLVQLVLDHRHERSRLLAERSKFSWPKIWKLLLIFWIPSVALVAAGLAINWYAQTKITEAIYASGAILEAPKDFEDSSYRSGIEKDVYYTIGVREAKSTTEFIAGITASFDQGDAALAAFPKTVEREIEKLRPPDIDEARACAGAVVSFRVAGKRITLGSFRGICHGIIQSIERMVLTTFERTKSSAVDKAQTKTKELSDTGKLTKLELLTLGKEQIAQTFDGYRKAAAATFISLFVLSMISIVLLICAIIGGFNLVLGRLIFDPEADVGPPSLKPHNDGAVGDKAAETRPILAGRHGLTFKLDPEGGTASRLEYQAFDALKLQDLSVSRWYVSFYAARIGAGTHMRLCMPQPRALSLQRLFTGRLLMTRVDVTNPASSSSSNSPVISAPGDLKLVRIQVHEGQQVVFHMSELLAFSDTLTLRSIYTAHVATHLLGLGSFYSVAEGPGYLVLQSDGSNVKAAEQGVSIISDSLLAWDRKTEFNLVQQVSLAGIWFNDPSVVSRSNNSSAIIDEGRAGAPGLLSRLWRLIRYLFMPF